MPWFYVDDGFSDSKPVMDMPDRYRLAACGLWVLAGSWSAKEELDGFVPDSKLRQLGARPTLVDVLTDANGPMSAPLWDKVSGGIAFKSWEKWQKTREELIANRRNDAERQRTHRAKKRKGRSFSPSADDDMSRCDTAPTDDVTDDPVTHGVTRDPRAHGPRPDPTRPLTDLLPDGRKSGANKRGSRLPDSWKPPTDVVAQMRADHPHVDMNFEHKKFCDYWRAQPGQRGVKLDWPATWRNWIRRAAEQTPTRNGTLAPDTRSTVDRKVEGWLAPVKTQPDRTEIE